VLTVNHKVAAIGTAVNDYVSDLFGVEVRQAKANPPGPARALGGRVNRQFP